MPLTIPAGSLAIAWLGVTIIQLVSGSPRQAAYLRRPVLGPLSLTVLTFLVVTVAWALFFAVTLTSPRPEIVPGWFGWAIIGLAATTLVASLILDVGNTWRSRHARHTPPAPSTEPDQLML